MKVLTITVGVSMFKRFKILKLSYLQYNGLKSFLMAFVCGGCMYNLYGDSASCWLGV
jgi:hypothetical protein